MRLVFLSLSILCIACPILAVAAPAVSFEEDDGGLKVLVDDRCVAEYVWEDAEIPRPYFCGVTALNGAQVTRNYPPDAKADAGNTDHPTFHPGIWLAFGDISGADFWRNKARVRHLDFSAKPKGGEGAGSFTIRNAYERLEGKPRLVCEEECEYSIHVAPHGYIITSRSSFGSGDADFSFGDQEEMGFGVRLATGLSVRHGQGHILNSAGGVDEKGTWGKRAKWCAGFNNVDGACIGMMVIPDSANFRPSWFHSRDYGLIVANPFGKKAMTAPKDKSVAPDSTPVKAGKNFEVRFAVYVFNLPQQEHPALEPLYAEYLDTK